MQLGRGRGTIALDMEMGWWGVLLFYMLTAGTPHISDGGWWVVGVN